MEKEDSFFTTAQILKRYPFLTKNMLKNWTYNNVDDFRKKVIHKIGRRNFFNHEEFIHFMKGKRNYD